MANTRSYAQINVPDGWAISDAWSEQGYIESVASGEGVNLIAPHILVAREVPPGARVYIEKINFRIVDMAAYDQLIFALRRNGAKLSPWEKISGEQIREEFSVDVDEFIDSGMLEIVATNISGTTEAGASPDAYAIRVIARFKGLLMREKTRQRLIS